MPRIKRPYERIKRSVVNQSERTGGHPRLIVLHATEGHNYVGIRDLKNLGDYFNNPGVQASSHVAVDAEGNSAQFVADGKKAWTCAGFNSASLNIEQIGFSAQKFWPSAQERKVAKYCAYWSVKYAIPLRQAVVNSSGGQVYKSGVCQHSNLGVYGGNHGDCGPNYPFKRVLRMARFYKKMSFR
jgi:N-acetyl-anhydromuramyl-L-alanine amidase AmpD